MNKTRFVVASALAAFAFAGAAVAPQASAESATMGTRDVGICWLHDDNFRWWCYNKVGAKVYAGKGTGTGVVGSIRSNPSWFYCRADDGQNHGGPHPRRWVLTVADNGERGWVSDNDIADDTNPMRKCKPGS